MGAQAVRLSNIDIDNAMKNKDFEVLFQPIFDLGNGALARMESFVRWRHPELGVLPPGAFISFFENQGRMSELTRYVLAEALDGYTKWRGPFAPGFSINLALSDLSDDAFANHFIKLLRDRDFPADLVTLECPMPPVDAPQDAAEVYFERLKKTGARLAIEVRGRANDFLRTINPFPFDEIKTGGSSILRFARTVRGPGLSAISDLLEIANKANAAITAVGVEDQASLAALRGLGFTAAQGNHLAKVGDIKDFRPTRVNEVRQLLDLPQLSAEDIAALFRTSAPAPRPADAPDGAGAGNDKPDAPAEPELKADMAEEVTAKSETAEGAEKRARAREKAKALARAKSARARAARKAAAIQRAKQKAVEAKREAGPADEAASPPQQEPTAVPRDLQERLVQEFTGNTMQNDPHDKTPGAEPNDETPSAGPTEEETSNAQTPAMTQSAEPEKKEQAPVPEVQHDLLETRPVAEKDVQAQDEESADVRLAVGGARAHFRPGIRVGGPPLDPQMHTSSMRRAEETQPPDADAPSEAEETEEAQDSAVETVIEGAPAPQEPEQGAFVLDEPPAREDAVMEDAQAGAEEDAPAPEAHDQSDLMPENKADETPPPPRWRKKKSFLRRRYRIGLPNHFWPKSWKRRYRRWKTARELEAME